MRTTLARSAASSFFLLPNQSPDRKPKASGNDYNYENGSGIHFNASFVSPVPAFLVFAGP